MDTRSPLFKRIATLLIAVMLSNPLVSLAADLALDAASAGNTTIGSAGNGVPVINIATPSGAGLSHNRFNEYNVGQQGLILNNATGATNSTQLGGIILGNPNVGNGAAGLILNEITGANPSNLRGYTEVAGQRAGVIVANPHGIACDGCGFINTPRVTLSTGKPLVEQGALKHFDVEGGAISIQGRGLNASNVDQFDLITRSAQINADLYANQLNIITGRNQVDANTLAATAKTSAGSDKPQLALDSSALGGMYAGAIRLIGTEQGVGVKLAGNLAASAGDIHIDAAGKLTLSQAAANQDIRLTGDSIQLSGNVYAGRNVDVRSEQTLSLAQSQSLAARERIELKGGKLDNPGLIEAGVNGDNSRNLIGDVKLSGTSLRNSGSVVASRVLNATLSGQLDNRAGTLSGKANTTLSAAKLDNREEGLVLSSGSLAVSVLQMDNRTGLIAGGQALSVTATAGVNNQAGEMSSQGKVTLKGDIVNNRGGLIAAGEQLAVSASELDNSAQGTLSSQGSLILTDAAVNNQRGAIVADKSLSLNGKSLDNRGGLVSGKAEVSVQVSALLDNSAQGTLLSDGKLTAAAVELRNGDRGQVAAKGDLAMTVTSLSQQGTAANQAGELLSQGKLTLTAERIDNRQGGLIAATNGLDIHASEFLRNGGGEISTQGKAGIRLQANDGQPTAQLDNSGAGLIIGDQGLTLIVQRLLNHTRGVLSGRDSLMLVGESLDNSMGGTLSSQRALSVQLTGALENQVQGALLSGASLTVAAGSLNNSAAGSISSAGAMNLSNGSLDNQGGKLVSDGPLNIVNARLNNSNGGVISAKQALTIGTGQLDNQQAGVINGAAGLMVTAGQLNNHNQGVIESNGAVSITATGLDQHAGGQLISESALTLDLQGGALNNSGQGLIVTPDALLLQNLGEVDNSAGGEIFSNQSFLLKASQLNNSAGRVISGQQLQLQISQALLNNLKGVLSAAALTVNAASLNNSGAGVLASTGDLDVILTAKLDNHDQGLISAAQALTVHSAELDNSSEGLLASGGTLQLSTGVTNNHGGAIASQGTLSASTAELVNRGGVVSSQQALTLTANAVGNHGNGLITSAAGLTITADSLDSSNGGEVSAKGDLRLTMAQLTQQQGRLIGEAGVHIDLQGGSLDNRGGLLSATGPLSLENLAKLDNRGGEFSSNQSFSLVAGAIDNGEQGRLISSGALSIDLSGALRNATAGLISGWQGLTVKAASLDNAEVGTLSSRDGELSVAISGALNNSGEGALVSKGKLTVDAASLDNSAKGIISSQGDLELSLSGKLDNHSGGLIDSQGALLASAGAVNNHAGQIGSLATASLTASSLDNSAGQLSSGAGLTLALSGDLSNTQQATLASAGPLLLKAAAIDNQGGSLISQSLLQLTASSLNNANGGTLAARNGLNLLLSGALNNNTDGLILSQQGTLAINALSLNNNAGVLSSQQDLTVDLDGQLDNQSGRIESLAGNLDLQLSSAVDNRAGVLSSLAGWLKMVGAGLFDNAAGTTQAQSLAIDAEGVDNRGGHLSALSGDTLINIGSASLINQGGGLYSHQLLEVIGGDFNNQGAAPGQGGKIAAGQIDFTLSGALRNSYGILESASTLNLAATSLNNQYGGLRALGTSGATRIDASSLDNRNGKIETANNNLDLNVAGLQSGSGSILHVGSGVFGLSAAQVTGAGGDLSTNGLLTLAADNWTNSGVLQAARLVLNIGTFTQTASGQLLAGNSFSGSGSNWVNDGLLASDGSFSLNLSGAYSGNGQAASLGDLSLSAGSISLGNSARIAGGGLTKVSANGLLSNLGKLTSAADLIVSANTLNNHGTLGSAERLRINAPNLLNDNGLIFSGGAMTLRANSFTNLKADIYSIGELSIARNDAGNQLDLLENRSGSIESLGDMSLRAAVLSNRKELFTTGQAQTHGYINVVCYDCSGDHHNVDYVATERFETTLEEDSAAAQIFSGGNLTIQGGSIVNRYSSLSAAGDIVISATTLANMGAAMGSSERVRRFNTGRVTDGTDERFRFNFINPYNALPLPKEVPGELYGFNLVSDIETQTHTGVGAAAVIQAGGSVSIQAAQTLENSVVREAHQQTGGVNRVTDTAAQGTGTTFVVQLNAQLPPDLQQQQVNPLTLPGFSLPQGENGLFRLSVQGGASGTASAVQGAAGVNPLNGSAVAVGAGQAARGSATATASAWALQGGQAASGSPTDTDALSLAGVQNLPSGAQPVGSHKYLIETNPELTNLKQFLGSDYMLGNLGYTPGTTQKRLGDGLYEQRLIREAIVARTGQRFLAGLTSDEAMFRYLMDNAIASKQTLNLSVGISLSAAQVAALTHDIVWMEEYQVAGEKVLVPVLYLAQAEGRLAPNGALIQGRDVTLISGGDLLNQGTLRASNNLTATANNISNTGLMQASKRLSLLATQSIGNAQGGIIAGRDVSLTTLTGDILNERSISQQRRSGRDFSQLTSLADSAARIEAVNDLSLSAGRDIQNIGGAVSAGGLAQLTAGRDVVIASATEEQGRMRTDKRHFWDVSSTTQLASNVQVGGDLDVSAGRDLAMVASRIEAGGDMRLVADNDVLIASAANEQHSEYRYRRSDKKITRENSLVEQQSAELIAGGDIAVLAGQDLIGVSSRIEVGGEAYLVAGNQLALLTAENLDHSLYEKKKKGSFGRTSSRSDTVTRVTQQGTDITTGGDLTLISGSDQTYQAADLTSGGDLTISSGGAIAFEGVKDLHQESHEKSKSSWAWQSAKGKGNTDETLIQSQLQAQGDLVIRAADSIQIDIKEVNQQSITQTIDAMVAAEPDLLWMKEMEQQGDVDWRLVKEVHDSFDYSSSGLSGPAAMVIAIAVAYFTAGAASALIGNMAAGTSTAFAAGTAATAATATTAATAATAAGWANVALASTMTSAASSAAISVINNGGDLGAVIKDVTSSDALKGYVTAGITAGVTTGVLDQAFGVTSNNIYHTTKGFNLSNPAELAQFGAYLGAQGSVQAVAQTAVSGGSLSDNLQSALTNQMQHLLQAGVFNAVGNYSATNGFADGSPEKIALHAMVGGMLSEATGGDFGTGALAAGANEALIEQLTGMIKDDKNLELAVSQLIGIAAATTTGGDYAKAAELAKNATAYNRQLHIDEIRFASDEERVKRYAEQTGITEEQARQDLLRVAAAIVDYGWTEALDAAGALSADAYQFLEAERISSNTGLFQVTEEEYFNERMGLKEMLRNREAVEALVRDIALVDPLAYRTHPEYFQEVMNAKGEGSQEGFGNVAAGSVDAVVWAAGAVVCPRCAMDELQAVWSAVKDLPEELSYKGYLDTLHTMQGGGAEVVRSNAASSTALGIGIGLGAAPAVLPVRALILERIGAKEVTPSAAEGSFGSQSKNNSSRSWKYENRVDVTQRPAAAVNADHAAIGNNPPYKLGTVVVEYTTKVADVFVRVHNVNNPNRPWMMRKEAIAGLSAEQIRFKYSLPSKPSYVSEVHVPAGTRIRTGRVEANFQLQGGGGQGGVQYEWIGGRVPESAIKNTRVLN